MTKDLLANVLVKGRNAVGSPLDVEVREKTLVEVTLIYVAHARQPSQSACVRSEVRSWQQVKQNNSSLSTKRTDSRTHRQAVCHAMMLQSGRANGVEACKHVAGFQHRPHVPRNLHVIAASGYLRHWFPLTSKEFSAVRAALYAPEKPAEHPSFEIYPIKVLTQQIPDRFAAKIRAS